MSVELDEDDGLTQIRHKELISAIKGMSDAFDRHTEAIKNMPAPDAPVVNVPKQDAPIVNVQNNNDEIKGLIQHLKETLKKEPAPVVNMNKKHFIHKFNRDRSGFIDNIETNEI